MISLFPWCTFLYAKAVEVKVAFETSQRYPRSERSMIFGFSCLGGYLRFGAAEAGN